LSILFAIISGIFKAICDLSEEAKLKFKNEFFWIKIYSWKNKWKLDNKNNIVIKNGKYVERFFGSSRWFVFLTDAWHLFGLLFRLSFATSFVCVGILISVNYWYTFASLVIFLLFAATFHIFYTYKIFKS
jgi:hypothetical protein